MQTEEVFISTSNESKIILARWFVIARNELERKR